MTADREARVLRDRAAALGGAMRRAARGTPAAAARRLVQVFDAGEMPSQPDHLFSAHPVSLDCQDGEGAPCTPAADAATTLLVDFLRGVPAVGEIAVATFVGGRWVAEKTGSPVPQCRWWCGAYVQFDPPSALDSVCHAATAFPVVADDGTIAGVQLLDPGACYTVPHPHAVVHDPAGTGATLLATVGGVTSLSLSDGGSGYDPAAPPSVTIAPPLPTGTIATATATVNPDGSIGALTLTDPGALYGTATPTVTISPPAGGGRQATATAQATPGVVTGLVVTAPGSGYSDGTPADAIDLTVSCPAWSATLTLARGGPVYFNSSGTLPPAPAGTLPYCSYGGLGTIDIPATDRCPAIEGVPIAGSAVYSSDFGWALTVNFALGLGGQPYTFPVGNGICPDITAYCMVAGTLFGSHAFTALPCNDGPHGATTIGRCASRPYAWTNTQAVTSGAGSCILGCQFGWYVLGGGSVSAPLSTTVPFTFTLSEP